jgi:hypothetical protein
LIYLTKQKPKADNMNCISKGKRKKGGFVAKGDINFWLLNIFPLDIWGWGVSF